MRHGILLCLLAASSLPVSVFAQSGEGPAPDEAVSETGSATGDAVPVEPVPVTTGNTGESVVPAPPAPSEPGGTLQSGESAGPDSVPRAPTQKSRTGEAEDAGVAVSAEAPSVVESEQRDAADVEPSPEREETASNGPEAALEPPVPAQGYYYSPATLGWTGLLHVDEGELLPLLNGAHISMRLGQSVNTWMDLGLLVDVAVTGGPGEREGFMAALGLEWSLHPLDPMIVRLGSSMAVNQLSAAVESVNQAASFGAMGSLGVGYSFYPFHEDEESGSWAFTPMLQLKGIQPFTDDASYFVGLGVEVTRWYGLAREQLLLPADQWDFYNGFDRSRRLDVEAKFLGPDFFQDGKRVDVDTVRDGLSFGPFTRGLVQIHNALRISSGVLFQGGAAVAAYGATGGFYPEDRWIYLGSGLGSLVLGLVLDYFADEKLVEAADLHNQRVATPPP